MSSWQETQPMASARAAAERPAGALINDLLAGALGLVVGLLILLYLHGQWMPGWAAICGGLGGIITRRLVRPSYAEFPAYLRMSISGGVVLLGTIVTSWATLVREPASYWLLRWREAATLPVVAAVIGLGLASVIYSHRRLERELDAKREIEEDLAAAREIQQSLLRVTPSSCTFAEAHAVNIPSRQVGGDYFELFETSNGEFCFAVGDVAGKGMPAALVMCSLQTAFLAAHSLYPDLASALGHINQFLADHTTPERYATFFVGQLCPDGRLVFVNAGHNPPMVVREDGHDRLFGGGMPLGLFRDAEYELQETRLQRGDLLVVYTDGVTEAGEDDDEFGEGRLLAVLTEHRDGRVTEVAEAVLDAVRAHIGPGREAGDDVTLLTLRAGGVSR